MENSEYTISKNSDMKNMPGGGDSEGAKVLSNELGCITRSCYITLPTFDLGDAFTDEFAIERYLENRGCLKDEFQKLKINF